MPLRSARSLRSRQRRAFLLPTPPTPAQHRDLRQLALRTRLKLAGTIDHEHVFFKADHQPIRNLQYAWIRWHRTLTLTLKGRYRDPYNARHSSVSWNLMVGKNPLLVAKQHGHGVNTMLEVYAAWIEGAKESDVEVIRRAMESRSPVPGAGFGVNRGRSCDENCRGD